MSPALESEAMMKPLVSRLVKRLPRSDGFVAHGTAGANRKWHLYDPALELSPVAAQPREERNAFVVVGHLIDALECAVTGERNRNRYSSSWASTERYRGMPVSWESAQTKNIGPLNVYFDIVGDAERPQ